MKKRSDIIRADDMIEVVTPRVVIRVGYPKTVADYLDQAKQEYGPGLMKLLSPLHPRPDHESLDRIYQRIAYLMACRNGFGGQERTAHFLEMPGLVGKRFRVDHMLTRMIGTRYPPYHGGYDSYSGEYDYEPGGLDNAKVLRICKVGWISGFSPGDKYLGFLTTDVKKVT